MERWSSPWSTFLGFMFGVVTEKMGPPRAMCKMINTALAGCGSSRSAFPRSVGFRGHFDRHPSTGLFQYDAGRLHSLSEPSRREWCLWPIAQASGVVRHFSLTASGNDFRESGGSVMPA